ncbi:hypothetical protein LTR56_021673 [Elasticomyces elasticus]|nr:hypothetical protein LTR56_021673 [Elasticomyces elasticus]KAK3664830.1 hypothetical protein LTR22_004420 [Elasticomyces elasticus]KAK4928639.1 hypothetical protein LTR49_004762 [Elasticomyces elasticus]KAK5765209.1 hypothetical protein LTS12_004723 [Elasticomyces elasticus]
MHFLTILAISMPLAALAIEPSETSNSPSEDPSTSIQTKYETSFMTPIMTLTTVTIPASTPAPSLTIDTVPYIPAPPIAPTPIAQLAPPQPTVYCELLDNVNTHWEVITLKGAGQYDASDSEAAGAFAQTLKHKVTHASGTSKWRFVYLHRDENQPFEWEASVRAERDDDRGVLCALYKAGLPGNTVCRYPVRDTTFDLDWIRVNRDCM